MPVNEVFLSFKDNIRKTRNPFFGTFIIVWLLSNWELILTLFNLHLYETMDEKVAALRNYFGYESLAWGFFLNAVITLIVMMVVFAFLHAAKYITLVSERKVGPWVYRKGDQSSIVLKAELDEMTAHRDRLNVKLEEARKNLLETIRERDRLAERLRDVESELLLAEEQRHSLDIATTHEIFKNRSIVDKFRWVVSELHLGRMLPNADADINLFSEHYDLISTVRGQPPSDTQLEYTLTAHGLRYWLYLVRERLAFDNQKW